MLVREGMGYALKENCKELAQKLYYEQWRYVALDYCQEVYASVVNVNVAVEKDVLGKRLQCGWGVGGKGTRESPLERQVATRREGKS